MSPVASPTVDTGEAPLPQQVLPPATDPPLGNLCTAPVTILADGNVSPLLCKTGAVNVKAWQYYASVSSSVLGLGLNPTQGQVESSICDDYKHGHATKPEETSGYKLATAYYGWKFNVDPANVSCQ
ncbi:MAG TPA: hypothetical protein VLK30_09335 [Candidatus Limnocylindrales bacterium]|nr:hypothetical protein [Candidatus Limnocylindrales bacterium]